MAKVGGEAANAFLSERSQYDRHPYFALPLRLGRPRSHHLPICCMLYTLLQILLVALGILVVLLFFLWPSKPSVKVVQIQLNHVNISENANSIDSLDISMDLRVQIHNRDFITRRYSTISMFIGYGGKWQDNTTTHGTSVGARSTSSVDITMQFDVKQVQRDVLSMDEDATEGSTSLSIAIEIEGQFQFLFLDVPVEGRMSCGINVDPEKQSITNQDCYPMHLSSREDVP